ncbi:unnamed protein product, partial [Darwinula stevensoni]
VLPHTILLVEKCIGGQKRTWSHYSNVHSAIEGVIKIYEDHLKWMNRESPRISYDLSQLFNYLDELPDLCCLVYQDHTNTYAPFDRAWIKERIYVKKSVSIHIMANEGEDKEYRWESGYEKTWEAIQEDVEGLIETSVMDIIQRARRKRMLDRQGNIRLGMMRHLYLILDLSETMNDPDLKPSRLLCSLKILESFLEEYFDQNPISQLGIITMKNKRAEILSQLAGNPRKHLQELTKLSTTICSGEPSLQNALELAAQSLQHMPSHASREILIIFGSLTTCDPGDLKKTIQTLKSYNIRVSIVGLAAEVRICRTLCKETGGEYSVIVDDVHLRTLILNHVIPPPAAGSMDSSLIRMGFPHEASTSEQHLALCMCHLEAKDPTVGLSNPGYLCPQCSSKYCHIPVECRVCGLTLVSAPHLARSYHHLFPLPAFEEVSSVSLPPNSPCTGCNKVLTDKALYRCPKCTQYFCFECDLFLHDVLHSCPGCTS